MATDNDRNWLALATAPSTVRRALGYAVVVGTVLLAINHGDAIVNGELTTQRIIRMSLTALVPYLVSTFSSVGAMRACTAHVNAATGAPHAR
ncbi:MAG: nitrate/nitrite transporter NrtS [Phycisphaerales bacterium]|nr:nitrate/nitrite transporter NrtS [Phycisphaerales bacterium]